MLNRVDRGSQISNAVAKIAAKTDVGGVRFEVRDQSSFPFNRATHTLTLRSLISGFPTSNDGISHLCNSRHLADFMDPHDIGTRSDGKRGGGGIALNPIIRFRVKDRTDE